MEISNNYKNITKKFKKIDILPFDEGWELTLRTLLGGMLGTKLPFLS